MCECNLFASEHITLDVAISISIHTYEIQIHTLHYQRISLREIIATTTTTTNCLCQIFSFALLSEKLIPENKSLSFDIQRMEVEEEGDKEITKIEMPGVRFFLALVARNLFRLSCVAFFTRFCLHFFRLSFCLLVRKINRFSTVDFLALQWETRSDRFIFLCVRLVVLCFMCRWQFAIHTLYV